MLIDLAYREDGERRMMSIGIDDDGSIYVIAAGNVTKDTTFKIPHDTGSFRHSTGKTDKRGCSIFEGDVLKTPHGEAEVTWDGKFKLWTLVGITFLYKLKSEEIEIKEEE